jgi:hypothetical protein
MQDRRKAQCEDQRPAVELCVRPNDTNTNTNKVRGLLNWNGYAVLLPTHRYMVTCVA